MHPRKFGIGVVAIAVSLALVAARPNPASAVAETYFGCLPGYAFQVSGQNARCYKAGSETSADIICGIGSVKVIDQFNGGKDGCQLKTNNVLTNYTCPSGFGPGIRPGPDHCVKSVNPSVLPPSVTKSL